MKKVKEMRIMIILVFLIQCNNILHTSATFLSAHHNRPVSRIGRSERLVLRKRKLLDVSLFATPPSDKKPSSSSSEDDKVEATRDSDFARYLRGLIQTGMKETIEVDSIVVARADIPSMGIYVDQSYELQSIYRQSFNDETNTIERTPLQCLSVDDDESDDTFGGDNVYTTYIKLYSSIYHKESGAVIVTPDEVGLVTLRTEVLDSIVFALPVLSFWTATCFVFASQYNERYGGNFLDALLGR